MRLHQLLPVVYGVLLLMKSHLADGFAVAPAAAPSLVNTALRAPTGGSRASGTRERRRHRIGGAVLHTYKLSSLSASTSDVVDDRGLIVGLNKYSHDSAVCIMSGRDGKVLFAGEKERLTRNKHDGGDTGELVQHALSCVGATLRDVRLVVTNNHHHRVLPFERRIPWSVKMGVYPQSYDSPQNLIPEAEARAELSHHLAHAWSAAELSPFDRGLIVVMDGMGEAYGAMSKAEATLNRARGRQQNKGVVSGADDGGNGGTDRVEDDVRYYNDLRLMREMREEAGEEEGARMAADFQQVPEEFVPHEAYREAESAFTFAPSPDGGPPVLTPVYKRWTRERSPPELYNHGFENMESLGAVYSRVSSHIFGDWNACGKVMGLAPWASQWKSVDPPPQRLTSGNLLGARSKRVGGKDNEDVAKFGVHWDAIEELRQPNELNDPDVRPYYASLASTVQRDLEEAAMNFVSGLRERTGEENLCLCGGVALNSVLNGKIAREAGFARVFVPPCPGDEGIAIGCAAFGYSHLHQLLPPASGTGAAVEPEAVNRKVSVPAAGVDREANPAAAVKAAPFWGKGWSEEEVEDELEEWVPWVDVRPLTRLEEVAEAISEGQVVAWFQGRGEFGPRALGSRSLLADPRDPQMPSRINTYVKKREDFRPFAPSVLAEEADDWFEDLPVDGSPYMSITAPARREALLKVPAVCHVDGSSRLQTVKREDNPLYHRLISAFFKLTGVPMVLNTSFNVMGEPIVDSPADAIRALVDSAGSIDMLVMHDRVITLRPFPPDVEVAQEEQEEEAEDGDSRGEAGPEGGGQEEEYDDRDEDGDYILNDEGWEEGLRPFQARPFMSEVLERNGENVVRVRVKPEDGRGQWVDLDDEFQLEILVLSDGSRSIGNMVDETIDAMEENEDEDEEGAEIEENAENAVLGALRVLYAKGLIGFDRMVEAVW